MLSIWTRLKFCPLVKGLTNNQTTNFRLIQLKEFAEDNFKFHENESKLSKQVENTVEKGEIARYEQFLLFPQCLQKACFPGTSKGVIVWEYIQLILKLVISKHIIIL